ncbi:Pyruvate kinase [Pseudomonas syringae pv. actinidiae]|uniref:Pyruvate kinase n=1 Tax=Pseudomonas syringae pv. actinidiae TaxID=103796 RepID=A0A2V0Q437_PSESF|nr:Pyruvate kinase [Pseudomonas syringae pv. actinidiae]
MSILHSGSGQEAFKSRLFAAGRDQDFRLIRTLLKHLRGRCDGQTQGAI